MRKFNKELNSAIKWNYKWLKGDWMRYEDLNFIIPQEASDYETASNHVIGFIDQVMKKAIEDQRNRIIINTNLRYGLPMENINKIAGPFVDAWAFETLCGVLDDKNNDFMLLGVEAKERLSKADIFLQFKKHRQDKPGIKADVDVKASSADIISAGKRPNITSYARIRTAYVEDPDYIFVILSLNHKVYSTKNPVTSLVDGFMEIVSYNVYDLKYIYDKDLQYNPSLGTGQLQIKDIHKVSITKRNTWEFCKMLDSKYITSPKHGLSDWLSLAIKHGWIKDE